jgi:hypothetical protein
MAASASEEVGKAREGYLAPDPSHFPPTAEQASTQVLSADPSTHPTTDCVGPRLGDPVGTELGTLLGREEG